MPSLVASAVDDAPKRLLALLEAQLDAAPDGVLVVAPDGKLLLHNRRFVEIWGMPPDLLAAGEDGALLQHAATQVQDAESFLVRVAEIYADEDATARDLVRLASGRVLERHTSPVRGRDGALHGRLWTFRDVTDRKRSEETLSKVLLEVEDQRRRLDNIVASVPGVVWETWYERDPAGQRMDFVSDQVQTMLGYRREEWLATPDFRFTIVHPDDRERSARETAEHYANGVGGTSRFRWLRKDGTPLWVETWSVVIKDARGRPVGMRGVTLDVTAVKRGEETAARLAAIVMNSHDAVYAKSPEGVIMEWNPGAERLYGYARKEIVGRPIQVLVPPERVDEEQEILARVARGEVVPPFETIRLRKDGTRVDVSLQVSPIRDASGVVWGASAVARDVSDRRRAEEALRQRAEQLAAMTEALQRSNRELDQFAYITSHDLKAPLRGIANLSRWIEEDMAPHLTDETREHMDLLRGRVRRMEALIDAILEYSRIGRVKGRPERVEVGALLHDVVDLLAPPPGMRVEVQAPMPTLVGERMRLQQVFMNLIGNAIKHHHRKESGLVRVRAEEAGRFWRFSVADDGPGIARRYHDKVFVLFQTLEARDKVEGAGIGLALVKKIVEGHGGSIEVESDAGAGATFRFTWPKSIPEGRAE